MESMLHHIAPEFISVLFAILLLQIKNRGVHVSLYNVSKETGLSIATVYRKSLELSRMGLLLRLGKGAYVVTPKGAFYLAAHAIKNGGPAHALESAIKRLKSDWGLSDLTDEEVETYVRLLLLGLEKLGRTPVDFCANDFGRTVQVLLPPNFGGRNIAKVIAQHLSVPVEMVEKAERVIARALLEFFPSVKLPDGCRVVVVLHGEYGARLSVLAAHCKVYGYTLGLKCEAGKALLAEAIRRIFQNNERSSGAS